MLGEILARVREFHYKVGARVCMHPCLLPCDQLQARQAATLIQPALQALREAARDNPDNVLVSRIAMALEEAQEWLHAHADGNLEMAADAWADRLYVLIGDAVATGLPADRLFDSVHQSNMSKDVKDGSGKAVKGERYVPPDIRDALWGGSSL